jgi:CubicO group peptidase (beta-lactamase class C family)
MARYTLLCPACVLSWLARHGRHLVAAWAVLGLVACGGGGAADDLPSPLSAAEVAQMLTSPSAGYPAALAVRVSTASADVQVRGLRRVGGDALQGDDAFPMGSMTKSMTATLAGVLVQEGRIGWASKVLDVLPELAATTRAEYAAVTLTDVLAHRGGIFPAVTTEQIALLPALDGTPAEQRFQLARWMLQQASSSSPGVRTAYSNGGYVLAAAMLERVGGQPYETLLQAKVFAPLGATVRFGTPGALADEPWGHAWGNAQGGGGRWQPVDPADPEARFPAFGHPAGGAKLSGADFARYLQMHLRAHRGMTGGVLTPATARVLHTVVQDGIALGWLVGEDLEGDALRWHNGSDDASYYGLMAMSLGADVATGLVVTGYGPKSEADASQTILRLMR